MRPEDEKNNLTGQEGAAPETADAARKAAEEADARAFEEGAAEADAAAAETENEEDYFSEKKPPKRSPKVRRKDMTPEQRRRRTIRDLIITGTVCGLVLVFFAICALCSWVGYTGNFDYIATVEAVDYDSPFTLVDAEESKTGYYEFVASSESDEFRVLQLTDVHIGAGAFSAQKGQMGAGSGQYVGAPREARPRHRDGRHGISRAFPGRPLSTTSAKRRCSPRSWNSSASTGRSAFGNHDTEIYSLYTREEIAAQVYMDEKWEHCLFREGPTDIAGKGNDVIVVKHPAADGGTKITQALVTIDSHSTPTATTSHRVEVRQHTSGSDRLVRRGDGQAHRSQRSERLRRRDGQKTSFSSTSRSPSTADITKNTRTTVVKIPTTCTSSTARRERAERNLSPA